MNIGFRGNTQTGRYSICLNGAKEDHTVILHVDDNIVKNQNDLRDMIKAAYNKGRSDLEKKISNQLA